MANLLKISDTHLKLAKFANGEPEIFATVQGEGINTGIPTVFIRLSLCNLRCRWCDTSYTWNWEGTTFKHKDMKTGKNVKYCPKKEIIELTSIEVMEYISKVSGPNIHHVVITGGEPLMHRSSEAFKHLLMLLKSAGYHIEIETNGTLIPDAYVASLIDQFNVSPKLENSGNSVHARQKDKVYKFFAQCPNTYFKFVVTGKADLDEIFKLQALYNITAAKILLMPEGRTDKETQARAQEIVELCKQNGYRFCNRLHVWIWDGALRGV
jgi:organic radical activating enzyme